ncbi:hypothetical protein [Zobellia galactanivorans]|uniref:YkuD domain-containing protein n=1 Tax=Zobellia galactanivorans (strain DSM 12802 / CCUG 47099 / CIP 106680 / NCIMB 13871 / Dsij) TaxID=63186 RepID=G0L0E4_ZOBGA|nr:hypothetical protein [Zobellia galactanivorans]CAZ94359.1 Conserved hypothetical protein [Zobellia galactanivorans]
MRQVTIIVTSFTLANAHIPSYPDSQNYQILYRVPLYRIYVEGRDAANNLVQEDFEAIRFGVHKSTSSQPMVVGMAQAQTHTLSWEDISTMPGNAWRVYDGFFIHEGPEYPLNGNFGSIGCVEICGVSEWDRFNKVIKDLTGVNNYNQISNSNLLTAEYEIATRPPLIQV